MRKRFISVNDAAEIFGYDRTDFRDRLRDLHDKHGGVIFTRSAAPNAKLWTTKESLRKHMPEAFGEITELDILELLEMLQETRGRLSRLEKKVGAK